MRPRLSNTVLYFAPHQDDELLTYGIDIANSVREGCDVHIILCTDGASSNVRLRLGNREFCTQCNEQHVYDLTREDFTATRDCEFYGSCGALGVKRENIHMEEVRVVDGQLTVEEGKRIIEKYLKLLGEDSTVGTMYPNPPEIQHLDHRRLGLAAKELKDEGIIKHLVLMEEPYVAVIAEHSPEDEPEILSASNEVAQQIEKAVGEYFLWKPAEKRYAVGFHSVPSEMNQLITEKKLYYHIYD